MEKKTIGGFIAALRKANGMTQKDLAEQLNVSDKTVSRWERDDGAPDLSLIPVIAEIFDVTCDELLRGQRKSPTERAAERAAEQAAERIPRQSAGSDDAAENYESPWEGSTTPRGEKQRQRLIKSSLSQYQNYTYIAMGISVVGMIAALIGNLAFLKAVLGFLLGTIFFAASIICQVIFVNRAFLSVEDAGIDPDELSRYKHRVIRLAEQSIGLTISFLGFTSPLMLVDAYMGLGADSMLLVGIPGAGLFLIVYAVVCYYTNARLLAKGIYTLTGHEAEVYHHNHALKRKCFGILVMVLICTMLFQGFGSNLLWNTESLVEKTVFNDYASFIAYMEQDIPYEYDYNPYSQAEAPVAPLAPMDEVVGYDEFGNEITQEEAQDRAEEWAQEQIWYDENGNIISEEEALTNHLKDADGNVVCTYLWRNRTVSTVTSSGGNDGLPILVTTHEARRLAFYRSQVTNIAFCLVYPVETLAAVTMYLKKRKK